MSAVDDGWPKADGKRSIVIIDSPVYRQCGGSSSRLKRFRGRARWPLPIVAHGLVRIHIGRQDEETRNTSGARPGLGIPETEVLGVIALGESIDLFP